MKKLLTTAMVPALALTLTLSASAQQGTTTTKDKPGHEPATKTEQHSGKRTMSDDNRATWQNTESLHSSKAIIGTRIKNAEGKDMGEIDELLIDPKTGKVSQVVVGLGGLFGVGEKHVVVPWSDVKVAAEHEGDRAKITMDQSILERAPKYDRKTASLDRRGTAPSASPATAPREDGVHKDPIGKPVEKK
jgi:sporulation protein YlmC with PRC-barrel domain